MENELPELYPLEVSIRRIKRPWGGWPAKVGELWSLSGPPHESLVLNGPLTGRWLTQIVGEYQQGLLGKDVELDPKEPFPFLIKFVLAARDLPVQVHPTEAHTQEQRLPMVGVDKVWTVLDARKGGKLYLGFREGIRREDLGRALEDEAFLRRLNAVTVRPGDVFMVPAGRVHAVGKGVKLVEIQRHSTLTYELFPRPKRSDSPGAPLNFVETDPIVPGPIPGQALACGQGRTEYLACTPHFLLRRLVIRDSMELNHTGHRMLVYTGLKGEGWLRWGFTDICIYIQPYQSVVVPALAQDLFFESDRELEVLETSVSDMAGETLECMLEQGIPAEKIIRLGGSEYGAILRDCLPDT